VADLLTRAKQDDGNRDMKGDSRRVRIFATYVRENGLPQIRKTSAALAGWALEGAGVALNF